ncbi:MAG: sigma-54 interaction domain-containing protein [Candidatus Neomarinimicrobiota bacterium]
MLLDIDRLQKQSGIIGNSDSIKRIMILISQVAPVDISVLVTGESGVGKEIIAKAIHKSSNRNRKNLVVVNCGAIPEGIIESELFGHKKGSFTGANEDRKGYFEEANKGTIFLDEIGETPLETQVKLLRVLESGEFMRVGEAKTRKTNVRVIAATNKDLLALVKKNRFRQDLYYRLKTVTINIPPLRKRLEDIGKFVERFSLEFTRTNDIPYRGFMPDAIRLFKRYDWPGNVRELKHFVEKLLVLQKGERITMDMVKFELDSLIPESLKNNKSLPVLISQNSDKIEIDLILRQLFMLKQDTELIQKILMNKVSNTDENNLLEISNQVRLNSNIENKPVRIMEEDNKFIRDDAIGEISIRDLEKEAIIRTLRFFNTNRRKTAKSLGMSERTLYRKIDEYGLETKIKKNPK